MAAKYASSSNQIAALRELYRDNSLDHLLPERLRGLTLSEQKKGISLFSEIEKLLYDNDELRRKLSSANSVSDLVYRDTVFKFST
jgi:hypothetical protein